MTYTIVLGLSRKRLQVKADSVSLNDIFLLVAQYYGDEWYGCSVSDENGNFFCNAVKDYYTDGDPNKSVYEWAIQQYNCSMRCRAGLCHEYETYDGTAYNSNYNPFVETN